MRAAGLRQDRSCSQRYCLHAASVSGALACAYYRRLHALRAFDSSSASCNLTFVVVNIPNRKLEIKREGNYYFTRKKDYYSLIQLHKYIHVIMNCNQHAKLRNLELVVNDNIKKFIKMSANLEATVYLKITVLR